ncbi:MAG: hypothetical protein KBG64_06540 [Clostridia bacterium]|nr:hypothetical protein [Clostridia bacterium]
MEGMTPTGVARRLAQLGIPTPAGRIRWQCAQLLKHSR